MPEKSGRRKDKTPPQRLSWGSMARTARASIGVAFLIAVSLAVLPQMRDMLAGVSDYSRDNFSQGIAYHASSFFLAFSAWYWSRTVLAARFQVPDDRSARSRLEAMRWKDVYTVDARVFNAVPRFLFLAIAFGSLIAAVKSSDWTDAIITIVWSGAGYSLLIARLNFRGTGGSSPRSRGSRRRPGPQRNPRTPVQNSAGAFDSIVETEPLQPATRHRTTASDAGAQSRGQPA